jgi:hypothetical protein
MKPKASRELNLELPSVLRGGGAEWLQLIQPGVTKVVLEMDYESLHPVKFHVKECLGPFTECTGAFTSFKTTEYYSNVACGMNEVMKEAHDLGHLLQARRHRVLRSGSPGPVTNPFFFPHFYQPSPRA